MKRTDRGDRLIRYYPCRIRYFAYQHDELEIVQAPDHFWRMRRAVSGLRIRITRYTTNPMSAILIASTNSIEEHREQKAENSEDELQGNEPENGHEADCEYGAKHDPGLPVEAIALPILPTIRAAAPEGFTPRRVAGRAQ